ncbi:MAG: DUF2269 family protein [Chloroflexi bacterium]|nr:DUF2269 family protein [Chloroflexota bacterium]
MDSSLLVVIFLVLHVLGAIAGFGPVFAFGILGPMAGRAGPNGGAALLEATIAIEKRAVIPAAIAQPITGLILIFITSYNVNFFSHYWLWISILLYAIAFYLAIFVQAPTVERMCTSRSRDRRRPRWRPSRSGPRPWVRSRPPCSS